MTMATRLNFGPISAVRISFASKRDGGAQARLSSQALGRPFLSGRSIPLSQQLRVSHHYRLGLVSQPSMRTMMALEPNWEEIAKKISEKVKSVTLVHIDQHSDPDAKIVELTFGKEPTNRTAPLLDTMETFKNLGLNVVRAQMTTQDYSSGKNKFYVTYSGTGDEVERFDIYSTMWLTIMYNLLDSNPTMETTFGLTPAVAAKVQFDAEIPTTISVQVVNPKVSELSIETEDRPGLLLDIIKTMYLCSIVIKAAVINTEGLLAKDKFYVSYEGGALTKSMKTMLTKLLILKLKKVDPIVDDDYEGFFD